MPGDAGAAAGQPGCGRLAAEHMESMEDCRQEFLRIVIRC